MDDVFVPVICLSNKIRNLLKTYILGLHTYRVWFRNLHFRIKTQVVCRPHYEIYSIRLYVKFEEIVVGLWRGAHGYRQSLMLMEWGTLKCKPPGCPVMCLHLYVLHRHLPVTCALAGENDCDTFRLELFPLPLMFWISEEDRYKPALVASGSMGWVHDSKLSVPCKGRVFLSSKWLSS